MSREHDSGKNGHSNRVGFVVPCKICFESEGLSFFSLDQRSQRRENKK